jgi:hypothetical protein
MAGYADRGADEAREDYGCAPHMLRRSPHGILKTVATEKPPVPVWRWGLWFSILGLAILVFYVLLTPVWLGLRALAWLADRTSPPAKP